MRRLSWVGLVGIVVALASGGAGFASFGAATPKPPAFRQPRLALTVDIADYGSPRIEQSADFNGDGYIDVVLVRAHWPTFDTYPIQILLNDRHGGFYDGTAEMFDGPVPQVQFPRKLVISDFNGDGRPDIFIADTGYDHDPGPGYQNTLVLSTPEGKLRDATANLPQQADFSHSATVGDVNGDGTVDIFVGNIYGIIQKHGPEILLNDGTGKFSACGDCLPHSVVDSFGNSPIYASSLLVDVNGDGARDLVLGSSPVPGPDGTLPPQPPLLLLNDGSGHCHDAPRALPPAPFGGTGSGLDIASADLNGDGHPDLLLGYSKTNTAYGVGQWIQILINNGDGTFRDETTTRLPQTDNAAASFLKYLQLVDLNGDGAPDIIGQLVEGGKDPPLVYLNDGHGNFKPLAPGYGNTIDNLFTIVDARGDGHRDFLTTSTYDFPRAPSYVVSQAGKPLRPGPPSPPTASRSGSRVTLWWPYDWGATTYQIWRLTSPTAPPQFLATTKLTRYTDPAAPPQAVYRIRAHNRRGTSGLSDPVAAH